MNNSDTNQAKQLNETAVKCRFFAQYLGQEVFVGYSNIKMKLQSHHLEESFYNKTQEELSEYTNPKPFLELNCLSKIKEEDSIAISKIFGIEEDLIFTGRSICNMIVDFQEESVLYNNNCEAIDYLRSKGYAVPFMNYDIELLKTFGWMRLS